MRTVVVETDDGFMVRRIPAASPLPNHDSYGAAAELATRGAAAAWGLPDFVYLPTDDARGSRTREIGDGTIILGDLGLAIQVKGREAPSGDPDKERRWIEKKTQQALRQANGTVRALVSQPRELTSLRGRKQTIDGSTRRWFSVIVLDHPQPPDAITPSLEISNHPAVVLTRGDWEFLFDQLKSTYAVATYIERVAGGQHELGQESDRYYRCALADSKTEPKSSDPRLLPTGAESRSTPMLPLEPAAHSDRAAHQIVRAIMEDIATVRLTTTTEDQRVSVLAELDRLPVGQRGEIGQYLMDGMAMAERGEWRDWRLRSVRGISDHLTLGYGTLGRPHTEEAQQWFHWWLQLRHYDLLEIADDPDPVTSVAVLLTAPRQGKRGWDTTLAAMTGPISLSADQLRLLREAWPLPGPSTA